MKQKILNMKYYITSKDVNILEKKYTRLRKENSRNKIRRTHMSKELSPKYNPAEVEAGRYKMA